MAEPPLDAPVRLSARQIFDTQALPLMLPTCGVCHKLQGGVGPAFLASSSQTNYDPYAITSTWPNFLAATPELSALLTKGQHEGPALTLDQYAVLLNWVQTEAKERAAGTAQPFNPAVTPFYPVTDGATLNRVQLTPINAQFSGAYIAFTAKKISATRGLQLSGLKFYNVRAGAVSTDQRAIRIQRPLFIVWQGTTARPDPVDSFATTDLTIPLEAPAKAEAAGGQLITPGLLTLNDYVPGNALSISFNAMILVPPAGGSNPCKTAGLNVFMSQVKPYINAPGSCTNGATCHTALVKAGGIDMSPIALTDTTDAKLLTLCETLKFYNSVNVVANNTDPDGAYSHPYKWWTTTAGRSNNCMANGFPNTCFTDFKNVLANWKAAEQ
jgi:hypothetical protein